MLEEPSRLGGTIVESPNADRSSTDAPIPPNKSACSSHNYSKLPEMFGSQNKDIYKPGEIRKQENKAHESI